MTRANDRTIARPHSPINQWLTLVVAVVVVLVAILVGERLCRIAGLPPLVRYNNHHSNLVDGDLWEPVVITKAAGHSLWWWFLSGLILPNWTPSSGYSKFLASLVKNSTFLRLSPEFGGVRPFVRPAWVCFHRAEEKHGFGARRQRRSQAVSSTSLYFSFSDSTTSQETFKYYYDHDDPSGQQVWFSKYWWMDRCKDRQAYYSLE